MKPPRYTQTPLPPCLLGPTTGVEFRPVGATFRHQPATPLIPTSSTVLSLSPSLWT
ncbi:hypothetical protein Hanom_Chr06g00513631 [Helianthus anomalus]